ncbi:hypothetical protein AOLI_G00063100 [Acnodon oligacanthus]
MGSHTQLSEFAHGNLNACPSQLILCCSEDLWHSAGFRLHQTAKSDPTGDLRWMRQEGGFESSGFGVGGAGGVSGSAVRESYGLGSGGGQCAAAVSVQAEVVLKPNS